MSVYWTWSEFLTTSIASIQFTVCGRSVNLVNHSPSSMAFCGDRCMIVCITWLPGHKCRWNIYTALWLRPTRSLASSVQLFIMPADTPKCTACGHNARNNPTATSFNARSSTIYAQKCSTVITSPDPTQLDSTKTSSVTGDFCCVKLSRVGSGRAMWSRPYMRSRSKCTKRLTTFSVQQLIVGHDVIIIFTYRYYIGLYLATNRFLHTKSHC